MTYESFRSSNKKSRKPLLHKAFRDFILENSLEIFAVCVVWSVFLDENEYRIHMPRGFMDDLERSVAYDKLHKCALW